MAETNNDDGTPKSPGTSNGKKSEEMPAALALAANVDDDAPMEKEMWD